MTANTGKLPHSRDHRSKVTAYGMKIKTQMLYIPKDEAAYKAKKLQQTLHIFDDLMLNSPEKVNIKDYLLVLDRYCEFTSQVKKGRIVNASKKTKKGMDTETLEASDTDSSAEDIFSV